MSTYDFNARPEVLRVIPSTSRRVLDVGCAGGEFGKTLKAANASREVWGVEPRPDVAQHAGSAYDRMLTGRYPDVQLPERFFDCIVFNDVLEHMVDPCLVLTTTHRYLTDDGVVVASIPNVRFVPVVANLAFRGRWEYQDAGVLDRTHLRFFTRRSMVEMFEATGYHVKLCRGINALGHHRYPRVSQLVAAVLSDYAYSGFVLRASRREIPDAEYPDR